MIERRCGLRLALEANPEVGALRSFGADHLDSHGTPQARVARPKHLAHSAFPQQRFQLIRSQSSARGEVRGRLSIGEAHRGGSYALVSELLFQKARTTLPRRRIEKRAVFLSQY